MADGDDDLERTEEPTSRRIDQAVEKGQVAFSREVTSFLFFAFFALIIIWIIPKVGRESLIILSSFFEHADSKTVTIKTFPNLALEVFQIFGRMVLIPIGVMIILSLASSFMQNGLIISVEPIIPKLEKISVSAGLKRIFSIRSFTEFLKGIFKISIIGYITFEIIASQTEMISNIPLLEVVGINKFTLMLCFKIVLFVAIMMMFIAAIDFVYQRYEYIKSLRMSKQELKEEYKQTEGNPEVKAKLKQIREQRARRRMMASVPKADVVIRNPTHFAIALEYKQSAMKAPSVIAMGQDDVALKIIEIAEQNKVAIVTNRNLAKALYETCELDDEIPIEHYKAVAEVIAYVYKLKGKTAVA